MINKNQSNSSSYSFNLVVFTIVLLLQTSSISGREKGYTDQLNPIIEQMKKDGNRNFILVEAYKEGLLREGKRYEFRYNKGTVSINGKVLPEPLQSKYSNMYNEFTPCKDCWWSVRSGGLRLKKDILNPQSSFRREYDKPRTVKKEYNYDHIVGALVADKLLDTTKAYKIEYRVKGIFVNGDKLQGATHDKYWSMFEAATGFLPVKNSDGTSIEHKP